MVFCRELSDNANEAGVARFCSAHLPQPGSSDGTRIELAYSTLPITWTWVTCFYTNMGEDATSVRDHSSLQPASVSPSNPILGDNTVYRCDLLLPPRSTPTHHTCALAFLSTQSAFVGSQDWQSCCHQATNTIPNLAVLSDRPIRATLVTATALPSNCIQSSAVVSIHHLHLSSHTVPIQSRSGGKRREFH